MFLFKIEDLIKYLKETWVYDNIISGTIVDIIDHFVEWIDQAESWLKLTINIIAIAQGSSEYNISAVVDGKNMKKAVYCIQEELSEIK